MNDHESKIDAAEIAFAIILLLLFSGLCGL